jgi:serine/threonine protein phosphatase PrpC
MSFIGALAPFIGASLAKKGGIEDAFACHNAGVAAIADGHGGKGSHGVSISHYACEESVNTISGMLIYKEIDPTTFYDTLPKLFAEIHNEYLQSRILGKNVTLVHDIPMRDNIYVRGGTTLTVAIQGTYQGRPYLVTANVGDSEAYLFSVKDGVYSAKELTVVHEPTSQSEYFRVQKLGHMAGHFVYHTQGATTVAGHLPIFEPDGTPIVYQKTFEPYKEAADKYRQLRQEMMSYAKGSAEYEELYARALLLGKEYVRTKHAHETSLDSRRDVCTVRGDRSAYIMFEANHPENEHKVAVTRAIGDYYGKNRGLTTEPHVQLTWLEDLGDKAVLFMATDGVFDCYHVEDVAKIVLDSDPSTLVTQFRAKAEEIFGEADDITYVIKQLK